MDHSKNFKDRAGQKVHRLTFLRFVDTTEYGCSRWLVRCECGCEFIALASNIIRGNTKSCGCYRNEQNRERHQH